MKSEPALVALLCRAHCRFFREGAKEELSCQGYDFFRDRVKLERLRRWIKQVPPAGPGSTEHRARAERILCDRCDFQAEDCDYQADPPVAGAVPCGGYILFCHLLAAGAEGWEELVRENG